MKLTTIFLAATLLLAAHGCARTGGASRLATETAPQTGAMPTATPVEKPAPQIDLAPYFARFPGAFVLCDLKSNRCLRHNPARAAERFTPFSTFKIPNSLIGLETGVIRDADFLIKWDAQKYPRFGDTAPFTAWWQDHTLRSAFKNSVVWYYRELATRVGEQRMQELLTKFHYGNADISGGIDRFWLNSSLKISADEQVEFLKALYKEELPVSKRTYTIFKDIFVLEQTPSYTLRGKTGGGPLAEGRALGWLVGYLETTDNVYFFATQIEGPNFLAIRDERINITKRILADLGYLK
jgi:beta-lactamase class D